MHLRRDTLAHNLRCAQILKGKVDTMKLETLGQATKIHDLERVLDQTKVDHELLKVANVDQAASINAKDEEIGRIRSSEDYYGRRAMLAEQKVV